MGNEIPRRLKMTLTDYISVMWDVEKQLNDYKYTTQVIEFLEWLNDEKKKANIEFWKQRLDVIENEIIDILKKLTPDEIKTLIQDNLLSILSK